MGTTEVDPAVLLSEGVEKQATIAAPARASSISNTQHGHDTTADSRSGFSQSTGSSQATRGASLEGHLPIPRSAMDDESLWSGDSVQEPETFDGLMSLSESHIPSGGDATQASEPSSLEDLMSLGSVEEVEND